MPTLPLSLTDGVPLNTGDQVVNVQADIAGEWSQDIQAPEVAPVRDAIQAGQLALMLAYQSAANYAAAQSDPLRATGEYLDEIGEERSVRRQLGELDPSYSGRVNAIPAVVTPSAIVAAANAVLAPYTAISCTYSERSDGCFLGQGDTNWSAHLFVTQAARSTPYYPDRLYPGTVEFFFSTPTGLLPIAARRPQGAQLNADTYGRLFELRAPDISGIDSVVAALFDGTESDPTEGLFLGLTADGTSAQNVSYLTAYASTADAVYNALIGAVQAIVGQSIRWQLYVDPTLTS